ncbi:hypothetical protein CR492_18105 [Methylocella silvestris]|uniref:Uncharacterized protein n=1 Tax=Methylocella silvestris TaxID=199596 RepID=A0A2J7TCR2_METSI|nr:hypothetical protein CR492_18105 [Methylocella silvestris]
MPPGGGPPGGMRPGGGIPPGGIPPGGIMAACGFPPGGPPGGGPKLGIESQCSANCPFSMRNMFHTRFDFVAWVTGSGISREVTWITLSPSPMMAISLAGGSGGPGGIWLMSLTKPSRPLGAPSMCWI